MSGKEVNKLRSIKGRDRGKSREKQQSGGCISRIFQLFDRRRHPFLTAGQPHFNTLPPPAVVVVTGQIAKHGNELAHAADKTPVQKKVAKGKQNVPTESSRTSLSSSCSSTFSSVECNKKSHPEPLSSCQRIFPETPSPNFLANQTSSSSRLFKQSHDMQDLIYREARVVSVKKEDGKGRAMKHIDSPRPLLQSKPVQPRVTGDGSTRVLVRDTPRFSYDGRASQYSLKSIVTIKELPRLSLDSKERSIRSGAAESRSNYLSTDIKRENEHGSNKRPSGVVARLMGLEAFPDSASQDEGLNAISRFCDESKQNQVSRSPRVTHKDPASPRLRNANSVKNQRLNSRFPLEPAPWGSQKPAYEYTGNNRTKMPPSVPSVYGETERRLTEIESKKSGKDPRDLKQILEAMEMTRKRLENKKEKRPSNVESRESKYSPKNPVSRFETEQSQHGNVLFSATAKGTRSPRRHGSQISPMNPSTDLSPRSRHLCNPSGQPHDLMDKKTIARTLRAPLSSKAAQRVAENPASIRRISGTLSPTRLQQTKNGLEKQGRPISPSSGLRRDRRQHSKQTIESRSPTRKLKSKSTDLQRGDDQSSGLTSDSRNLSHYSDAVSVQSESSISFVSQFDTEVTSVYPSKDAEDKNFDARSTEDKSIAEQPSPVSVLDATFYGEGSPSPVKKISNAFEDDETAHYNGGEWDIVEIDHLLNSTRPSLGSKFNNHLVHKLRLANPSDNKANIDHIESLCNTNPDHRYVTQILLASGFLQDSSTIQLHPASHFINPNLFHVLEKTKGETEHANDERSRNIAKSKSNKKIQRKLLFDAVNEILGHKLASAGSSIFPKKLERRRSSGEKLLEEVWSELVKLQSGGDCSVDDEDDAGLTSIVAEDTMNQSNEWTGYGGVSGLVLDIERLIFKDLIREVVNGGATDLKDRQRRHCRQLFSK